MDGYLPNTCEYDNCGKVFYRIHDLVLHIEANHIDFDADCEEIKNKLHSDDEDFPTMGIPMSLILPYGNEEHIAQVREKEAEEELAKNESNYRNIYHDHDSETPKRAISKSYCYGPEMSPDNLMHKRELKRMMKTMKIKKYACPVRGCTKSYKNVNGMKYHVMNCHDINGNLIKPAKVKKEYNCVYCDKDYKTIRGFQSHIQAHQQQLLSQHSRDPSTLPTPLMEHVYHSEPTRSYDQTHPVNSEFYSQELPPPTSIKFKRDYFVQRRHLKKAHVSDTAGDGIYYFGEPSEHTTPLAANSRRFPNYLSVLKREKNSYLDIEGPSISKRYLPPQMVSQGATTSNVLHKKASDNGSSFAQGPQLSAFEQSLNAVGGLVNPASRVAAFGDMSKWNYANSNESISNPNDYASIAMQQLEHMKKEMMKQQFYESTGPYTAAYGGNESNQSYVSRKNIQRLPNIQYCHKTDDKDEETD